MKKSILAGVISVVGLTLEATPVVTDVTFDQNRSTRGVEITYKLPGEAAVVTLDIQTNGVSIGVDKLMSLAGDVNALVQPTSGDAVRRIFWDPVADWPSNRVNDASLKAVVTAWATNAPPDYIVYDLAAAGADAPAFYTCAEAVPFGVTNELYKTRKLVMRRIHATGVRWLMGSPSTEADRQANETLHEVTLTNDYYMAIYPFTQGQYKTLTGSEAGTYSRAMKRENYLWRPCEGYINPKCPFTAVRGGDWPSGGRAGVATGTVAYKLRERTGQTTFDLPTEAQWEFACRAGTTGPYNNGGEYTQANFRTLGWENGMSYYGDTTDSTEQPVGFKEPNAWGLYDMHGTIIEICLDWYQADLGTAHVLEPVGPASDVSGLGRVTRGGGMVGKWTKARSAFRGYFAEGNSDLSTGYRFMCDAVVK